MADHIVTIGYDNDPCCGSDVCPPPPGVVLVCSCGWTAELGERPTITTAAVLAAAHIAGGRLRGPDVRDIACPKCGAAPGEPCMGARRPRTANHAERVRAARR